MSKLFENMAVDQTEWKGFCCNIIAFPGWSRSMMSNYINPDINIHSKNECCCCVTRNWKFNAEDPSGKTGELVVNDFTCCGLYDDDNIEGMAEVKIKRYLCSIIGKTQGHNEYASFWSFLFATMGMTYASGDHGGCGCTLPCMGYFCGKAKRSCITGFWESGCKTY